MPVAHVAAARSMAEQYMPSEQSWHAASEAIEYSPEPHRVAAEAVQDEPAGHGSHDVLPVLGWYLSASQATQAPAAV